MDKQQVIETYIEKNNKKSILGFLGINKMLGIDKAITQYLNGELNPDIKSTEGFGGFLKSSILINFFLKNKKNELDKLKEYLDLNKENKIQLESLANEIKKGTKIENALEQAKSTSVQKPTTEAISSGPTNTTPTNSQQEKISSNTELKNIRSSIEIKGDFAQIKEVKNSEGKIILECNGKSPYIHIDALDDLILLAQDFFQKTGSAFTLVSAYRTIEQQKKLKKEKGKLAADPGESGHNLGLSIDIEDGDRYSKAVGGIQGIRELAKKYNFYPLSTEDWHFDYKTLPDAGNRLAQAQVLDKDFQERNLAA